jgi:hypothetical protein
MWVSSVSTFFEETVFSPKYVFGMFFKNQMAVAAVVYFWDL